MMTRTTPTRAASTCPLCSGTFETCRCTGVAPLSRPRAGVADDIRREDDRGGHDGRGYERDESDRAFRGLVEQLVAEGDGLAAAAGRQGRRTLAQMDPGTTRQPVLLLTRPLTFTPSAPAGPVAGGTCGSCNGAGGKTIDTSGDGVTRQHWQTCTSCSGTGVAR
ncbi:hypothetical protein [Streptomyces sp. NRRL F-5702]|uniref:hypothetical protein n=1 Tax=Streptomyces sp. NRRL F-5702 TaxID=1463870 RepID=UPI0018FE2BF9|nr:hypothetical protein [Streptomyces sp. NRRL F-5702]